MSRTSNQKCLLSWGASLLFLLALPAVQGGEHEFPAHNCAITLPDGWQERIDVKTKYQIAAFSDPQKTVMLQINVSPQRPSDGPIDERFVEEFEAGWKKSGGGNRESGEMVQLSGMKAYERTATLDAQGKHYSTISVAVPTLDKFYNVSIVILGGRVQDHPEFRKIVESFRFLQTPLPPKPLGLEDSVAFKRGELVGQALFYVVGIVVVVVVVVRKRRRKSDSSLTPPPLPPQQ